MIRSIVKNKNLYFILGVLFIFVIWDLGKIYFNNDYIVPGVEETFYALIKLLKNGYTYIVLGCTLLRLLISIGACFVIGVILAILSKISYQFKAFIGPIMVLFKTFVKSITLTSILSFKISLEISGSLIKTYLASVVLPANKLYTAALLWAEKSINETSKPLFS